jgi:hypothetical protein
MLSMHSHENMVRGTIDVLPAHAPRMGSSDAQCGGGSGASPPLHAYENTSYFEPKVCEYWRESDGPLILRKGQAIRASCLINNGVNQTSQIDDPAVRQAVEGGPLGDALYAGRDSSEFRVRYGCEDIEGVPPGSPHVIPPVAGLGGTPRDCPPNPAKDAAGRPVDGAYDAPQYCPPNLGYTGRCVPAGLVFANTATDTMCIPIIMYWPLDRILNADGSVDEGAMQHLQDGDVNEVGTPGRVWKSPSDTGSCDDGAGDGGVNVAQPVELSKGGRRCRAGL